jgi:hypothetical protein
MGVRRGLATVAIEGVGEITVAVYAFGGRSWIAGWPAARRRPKLTRAQWRTLHTMLDDIAAAIAVTLPEAFDPSPEIFDGQGSAAGAP